MTSMYKAKIELIELLRSLDLTTDDSFAQKMSQNADAITAKYQAAKEAMSWSLQYSKICRDVQKCWQEYQLKQRKIKFILHTENKFLISLKFQ